MLNWVLNYACLVALASRGWAKPLANKVNGYFGSNSATHSGGIVPLIQITDGVSTFNLCNNKNTKTMAAKTR